MTGKCLRKKVCVHQRREGERERESVCVCESVGECIMWYVYNDCHIQ